MTKPTWDEYFIRMTHVISRKSHDAQTKVGCVIVNSSNEVVTTGYNGFIRGIDDNALPNKRPHKYPWMIHAEHNALISAARQGKSTLGCKVYVTGQPCFHCLQYMYQAGVTSIVYDSDFEINMCQDKDMVFLTEIFMKLVNGKFKVEKFHFDAEN